MSRLRRWPKAILIAIDQLANAICLGSEDETISSRCWRAKLAGKRWGAALVAVIDAMPWFGRDHCRRSWEAEQCG